MRRWLGCSSANRVAHLHVRGSRDQTDTAAATRREIIFLGAWIEKLGCRPRESGSENGGMSKAELVYATLVMRTNAATRGTAIFQPREIEWKCQSSSFAAVACYSVCGIAWLATFPARRRPTLAEH